MVHVQVEHSKVVFSVIGLHRLWAFKRRIIVDLSQIRHVHRMDERQFHRLYKGLRFPGTHIPGVLAAGTFLKSGERHFWDVHHPQRALEIQLEGAAYDRLFAEVEDPAATLDRLCVAKETA